MVLWPEWELTNLMDSDNCSGSCYEPGVDFLATNMEGKTFLKCGEA